MNFKRYGLWSSAAVASIVLLATSDARAQAGASVLTGRISDTSTKLPVADVVVTVTSPALQGEETAVTDANGFFRVQNLPPGEYTIRLDKESFKPYSRSGIELRADVTIRVDSELLPESFKEEVAVVARNPTVDVGSSNTGANITGDFTRRVPVVRPNNGAGGAVRSFEAAAQAAPQATGDAYGTSINGTTSPENNYVVDGLSRNNGGFGVNGARLSMEFVKEVNVLTGGYMPEYGAAGGGILSAVTKSGSNEFHGGSWFTITPGFLEADRKRVLSQSAVVMRPTLSSIGDFGAEIGGPIVKDKLWFYTGFMMARTAYNLDRATYNQVTGELFDQRRSYQATREDTQVFGKLTYALDSHNRFALSAFALPTTSGGSDRFHIDPLTGLPGVGSINGTPDSLANHIVTNTTSVQLDWDTETPSKKVLLKSSVGWMHQLEDTQANDGSAIGDRFGLAMTPGVAWRRNTPGRHSLSDFESLPPYDCDPAGTADAKLCPVTTYNTGGPGFLSTRIFDRWQAKSVLTLLGEAAGQHVVKFGADLDYMQYSSTRGYSGRDLMRESASGKAFSDYRNYSYLTSPDERVLLEDLHWKTHSIMMGGFAQDSWSILNKVTLNAGARYDAQLLYGGDGALTMALPNQISPRVGLVWDPTQEGRAKIYGNYARFYQPVPLNIMDRSGSSEPSTGASRSATVCDPRDPAQLKGVCQDPAKYTASGAPQSPDKKYTVTGAGKTPIDPDLKPQYSEEIVVGSEVDVVKNGRIGVSYTRRWMGRIIEDVSRDEAQTYYITNPGEGSTRDFPKPERTYDALTLSFQKAFSENWEMMASYTLSYLRGNWVGLFRPETGQLDPMINSDFDLKSLMINRSGPLPGDTRHNAKVFASKLIDLNEHNGLQLGGAFRAQSGGPTSYLGSHPLYGREEVFILPRGEGNRLPWTYSLDTSVGYQAKLTKDQTITVTMDVFNLLNFQEITGRDQEYTTSDVNPIPGGTRADLGKLQNTTTGQLIQKKEVNPNFGNPTSYQLPRQFRFGIRGTF